MEALGGVLLFCLGFLIGFVFAAILASSED